jgi:hypothetical protein
MPMRNNRGWTAKFAAIGYLRPAPAHARQGPGVRGGFANTAGEKATCDKRNRPRLIALAFAAMFALAGSAAKGTNRRLKRAARPHRGVFPVFHDPGWRTVVGHFYYPSAIPVLEPSEPLLLKVAGVFSVRLQIESCRRPPGRTSLHCGRCHTR